MKNKKITIAMSLILAITMLFGTFSVSATELTTNAGGFVGDIVPTTQAPEETTTDSYYDDSEYESEEEKEVYNDGYWDGYYDGYGDAEEEYKDKDYEDGYWDGYNKGEYDGYWQGYYAGYNDGVNAYEESTIIDKIDNLTYELKYRIELFFARIVDFLERFFEVGDYTPSTPIDPDDDFIPDGSQATLEGNAETQALCEEFNALVENAINVKEPVQ